MYSTYIYLIGNVMLFFRVLLTEASHTSIKNAVKYYGEGVRNGAHIPINTYLMSDLDKEFDARDIKYTVDKWLTYKPLKKQANWMVNVYLAYLVIFWWGPTKIRVDGMQNCKFSGCKGTLLVSLCYCLSVHLYIMVHFVLF